MTPRLKGSKFEIQYRVPGYAKPFSERFDTMAEAKLRIAQIEFEKENGTFQPPKPAAITKDTPMKSDRNFITLGEFLDEYVQVYGLNHWGDSYLSCNKHRIDDYIKPYIGKMALKDLTPLDLDMFLDSLQTKKAVVLKGHKDTGKTVAFSVVEKIHTLLRSALSQAVVWGYLTKNPAEHLSLPKHHANTREVWTPEEAQEALDKCGHPALRASMMLALGCSMRIGEILGLTWDCVDCSDKAIAEGSAHVSINKELKRCDKSSLHQLEQKRRSTVTLVFPEQKKASPSSTCLVLKAPKTESSIRDVFLPETVALELQQVKARQEALKHELGEHYTDYGLVIAWEDGRPYEERRVAKLFRDFIRENSLREVVFHSLRHCSASVKLAISGGNIKAVQGDTGHAQARMVTDLYAHSNVNERRSLARKMDAQFFKSGTKEEAKPAPVISESDIQMLQAHPEMLKLLLTVLQAKT